MLDNESKKSNCITPIISNKMSEVTENKKKLKN